MTMEMAKASDRHMYMKAHEPMVVLRKGSVTSLYIYNVKVGFFQ